MPRLQQNTIRSFTKPSVTNHIKNVAKSQFCKYSEKPVPVDLAYVSLENVRSPDRKTTPPLVIMHGLNGSRNNFNHLSHRFHEHTQPQRTIITVDARNHGDSPHSPTHTYPDLAEDIVALLKRLRIKKAALMGHSMGGRTMMYCALNNPDVTEKLVVIDISPVSSRSMELWHECLKAMNGMQLPKNDIPMNVARQEINNKLKKRVVNKALRQFLLTNLVHHKTESGYTWRANVRVLLDHVGLIASFPQVGSLKFSGPVLFICGKESNQLPESDHRGIRELFPNAIFEYVDGAGHWVHHDKPQEFEEVCLKFLNGVD